MIVQINRPTVQAMVGSANSMKQATLSRLARTPRCQLSNYQISQNSVLHLQDVLVKTLDRRRMTKATVRKIGRPWIIVPRKGRRRSQRRIRRITPPFNSRKNADWIRRSRSVTYRPWFFISWQMDQHLNSSLFAIVPRFER